MHDLFPPIEPFETGWLPVGSVHEIYWEQSGNPQGQPALFLHGGPGAGSSPSHRRFFDPSHYRVIVHDQRGAGRSRPLGELRDNSPDHLVQDIERLRRHLNVDRWLLFGGSWGSTLALLYAQRYPGRVSGIILRGVFTMRAREIQWFMQGMRAIFPEAWDRFAGHVDAVEPTAILAAYHTRLTSEDTGTRMAAARAWSRYEGACSTLLPSPEANQHFMDDRLALSLSRIECHYFKHHGLEPETRVFDAIDRIRHLPAVIVQGRYDIICPIETAYELHLRWPQADYIVVPDAGHSALEPGICRHLIQATQRFRDPG